jgi:hypothetical protein
MLMVCDARWSTVHTLPLESPSYGDATVLLDCVGVCCSSPDTTMLLSLPEPEAERGGTCVNCSTMHLPGGDLEAGSDSNSHFSDAVGLGVASGATIGEIAGRTWLLFFLHDDDNDDDDDDRSRPEPDNGDGEGIGDAGGGNRVPSDDDDDNDCLIGGGVDDDDDDDDDEVQVIVVVVAAAAAATVAKDDSKSVGDEAIAVSLAATLADIAIGNDAGGDGASGDATSGDTLT